MSSSEQGNRQGAAPPRVTGAATAAAAAAAARAPLAPPTGNGTAGSPANAAGTGAVRNGAAAASVPVANPAGYGAAPAGRSTAQAAAEAPPTAPAAHSSRMPEPGAEWASTPPPAARPAPRPNPRSSPMYGGGASTGSGSRSVRLTVAGLDPWSVLKLSFLLSVAVGIALVVASVVLWSVLNGMGVFDQINRVLLDISGSEGKFNIYKYVGLGRVVSLSTVLGVVNVVLMTALSTLGAFLYNLGSGLVGGLHVTLTDD